MGLVPLTLILLITTKVIFILFYLLIEPLIPQMIDPYVILAMPFNSFLVVVIYIEILSFYFGNAT